MLLLMENPDFLLGDPSICARLRCEFTLGSPWTSYDPALAYRSLVASHTESRGEGRSLGKHLDFPKLYGWIRPEHLMHEFCVNGESMESAGGRCS